jgi:hypothetical protein
VEVVPTARQKNGDSGDLVIATLIVQQDVVLSVLPATVAALGIVAWVPSTRVLISSRRCRDI